MRVLELPDMLRKYDVEPVIVAGFETRGNEFPDRPFGALRHWTVGGLAPTSSLRVVTFGRGEPNPLPGPLCQILQSRESGRDDKAYCVASGKANHAGAGNLNGISGNYKLLGLEIEWQGPNEPFSSRRKDVSERVMAALLDCCQAVDWGDAGEHREYALPRGRKVDTNLDGDELRDRLVLLRSGASPIPTPITIEEEEDNDMRLPAVIVKGDQSPPWYVTDGVTRQWIQNRQHAAILISQAAAKAETGTGDQSKVADIKPYIWPQVALDSIRLVGKTPS